MSTKKTWLWHVLNFYFKWYYRIKRAIVKPEMRMHGDLMPVGHKQTLLLRNANQLLINKGITNARTRRRMIERKLRIKVIPDNG